MSCFVQHVLVRRSRGLYSWSRCFSRSEISSFSPASKDAKMCESKRCLSFSTSRKCHRNSKVPEQPFTTFVSAEQLPEDPEINMALVEQLERMSLVEFANEKGLKALKNAVKSANQLLPIDTNGLEPLVSTLEDRCLWLRGDEVKEGNCAREILSNATKVEEQYFVAPPGNIPLKKKQRENFSDYLEQEKKLKNDDRADS